MMFQDEAPFYDDDDLYMTHPTSPIVDMDYEDPTFNVEITGFGKEYLPELSFFTSPYEDPIVLPQLLTANASPIVKKTKKTQFVFKPFQSLENTELTVSKLKQFLESPKNNLVA